MLKKFKHHDFATFFSFLNTFPAMYVTFGEKRHADKHPLC